jgi:hypothetical protein
MAKKGELSKTARASLGARDDKDFLSERICAKCGERINMKEMFPVKVANKGMTYYHKSHYSMQ